jgi:ubiquitin-like-conjugating enzyme ATG10
MKPQHPSSSRSEFHRYPFLTPSEFTDAAHHLDRRYCQATLGPVRRQWRLRMCTALNTTAAYTLGPEYSSYVQIARPLEGELDDGGLAGVLRGFSFGEGEDGGVDGFGGDGDREMVEAEEGDQVGFPLWVGIDWCGW